MGGQLGVVSVPIFSARKIFVYTYFKKRCGRERPIAVVERKLRNYDRKELWFPYLICKNNDFFAWR